MREHDEHFVRLVFSLDRSRPAPVREQIVRAVVAAIRNEVLQPGDALPSSRALATELGVARSTVVSCYLQLEGEGWLDPVPGSGTFVAQRAATQRYPQWSETSDVRASKTSEFDLRCGRLDRTLLDTRAWRAAWRENYASDWSPPSSGEPALLEQLAAHLRSVGGFATSVEDVVVCSGIAEGLLLLGLALGWAGRTVVVEDPCYNRARSVLTRLGAHVVPIDASDPETFVRGLESTTTRPVAVYVTPNHQFPFGHRLGPAHRARLLRWARVNDCLVIEDDYNSEHRFGAAPPSSLSHTDPHAAIVYLGSFSKWLDPGLRLGFMRIPSQIRSIVHAVRHELGPTTAHAVQLVAARLLGTGEIARQCARTRRIYNDRRDAMVKALTGIPAIADIRSESAGLHVVAMLARHIASRQVVAEASARGLVLHDLDFFRAAPRPDQPGLILGFALLNPSDIRRAVPVLGSVLAAGVGG